MAKPILKSTNNKKVIQFKSKKELSNSNNKKNTPTDLSWEELLDCYSLMLKSRLIDEKTIVLYKQNKCHFQIGAAGHEAVQIASSKVFRASKDWFYPYYREMALMVGLGMTTKELILNALNKEDDPNSHGRQMPMHYGSKRLNVVNQSSPTGTQYLQAVGCALASKYKKLDEVVYVSSGEGACAQGDFHEALNWASRDKLPVVFMIQNNQYAISVHVSEQLGAEGVYQLTSGYQNLKRFSVDGTDVNACYQVLKQAYDYAKNGSGPALIEANVPRLQSHSISDNHLKYRTEEDIKFEKSRCPIAKLQKLLIDTYDLTKEELDALAVKIKKDIDSDSAWAEEQNFPDPEEALSHTFVDLKPESFQEKTATGEEVFIVDAINHALEEEMKCEPNMLIFGQDVAHGKGGVFTVTAGLTDKFGKERVFNSQLAESSIAGVSIGLATRGLKPVAEIQFGDYVWTAMMQIRNELATMNYRSKGDFTAPAVLRIPVGGYISGGIYHSQNIEATFSHFPGIYIIYPSNATDAKGLLKSAIRCKDPVLFLEHKGLYRQTYAKGPEGDKDYLTPIGKAKVVREGTDCTIVTWGALVQKSILTAKELEKDGISVEVIDIRTIVPLDIETIYESVKKTHRVLIAHEDTMFMGFGAEIAAKISEECFSYLDAPIKRVGMKYCAAVPHAEVLEKVILPQTDDVIRTARELMKY